MGENHYDYNEENEFKHCHKTPMDLSAIMFL